MQVCKQLNKRKHRILYKFKEAFSLHRMKLALFESDRTLRIT